MGQQNNNNQNDRLQQNKSGQKDQPHKMSPGHDNRPQEAKDNNQGDKPGRQATNNNDNR